MERELFLVETGESVIFFMEKSAFFILFSVIFLCKRHAGDYIIS